MSATPSSRNSAIKKTILTPVSDPLFGSLFSLQPWTTVWKSRRLIKTLTVRRLQERFRGSMLGAVWVFLLPLLMLAVYAFAFVGLLGIGGDQPLPDRIELVLKIFVGLIIFGIFNETGQRAATSIISQPQFVKKVVFPLDALPVVPLGENIALASASLLVLLCGTFFALDRIHATWLLLPLPIALLAMFTLGLSWLLATIGVFVRDLSQALGVIMQMLFFLSPVCYTVEMVPPWAQSLVLANPVAAIIEMTRDIVLRGTLPDPMTVLTVAAIGAALIQIGHAVFTTRYRRFADVL